ncbi:MAG: hypothetical protein M1829_006075 [Trizodia sp. TS-e1964]|nr:MAG: hypothetical protein M1829_006075 [Trizodia sp. TS-e1964]
MRLFDLLSLLSLVPSALCQDGRFSPPGHPAVLYSLDIPRSEASLDERAIYITLTGPSSYEMLALTQGKDFACGPTIGISPSADGRSLVTSFSTEGQNCPSGPNVVRPSIEEGSGIFGGVIVAKLKFPASNIGVSEEYSAIPWSWCVQSRQSTNSGSFTFQRSSISVKLFQKLLPRQNFDAPNAFDEFGRGGRRRFSTSPERRKAVRIAHGTLMGTAFTFVLPLGTIFVRLFRVKHLAWVHGGIQLTGFSLAIAGLGCGVWLGLNVRYLDYAHTVIGMAVLAALVFQPFLGILHHRLYKKHQPRTWASYAHILWGRALLLLGMINGGLGLRLAENTTGGRIAYGVVAGVTGTTYLMVIVFTEFKNRNNHRNRDLEGKQEPSPSAFGKVGAAVKNVFCLS